MMMIEICPQLSLPALHRAGVVEATQGRGIPQGEGGQQGPDGQRDGKTVQGRARKVSAAFPFIRSIVVSRLYAHS